MKTLQHSAYIEIASFVFDSKKRCTPWSMTSFNRQMLSERSWITQSCIAPIRRESENRRLSQGSCSKFLRARIRKAYTPAARLRSYAAKICNLYSCRTASAILSTARLLAFAAAKQRNTPLRAIICHLARYAAYTETAKSGKQREVAHYRCEDCTDCTYRAVCCKAKDVN